MHGIEQHCPNRSRLPNPDNKLHNSQISRARRRDPRGGNTPRNNSHQEGHDLLQVFPA